MDYFHNNKLSKQLSKYAYNKISIITIAFEKQIRLDAFYYSDFGHLIVIKPNGKLDHRIASAKSSTRNQSLLSERKNGQIYFRNKKPNHSFCRVAKISNIKGR